LQLVAVLVGVAMVGIKATTGVQEVEPVLAVLAD
jgi:hypothetical protein